MGLRPDLRGWFVLGKAIPLPDKPGRMCLVIAKTAKHVKSAHHLHHERPQYIDSHRTAG